MKLDIAKLTCAVVLATTVAATCFAQPYPSHVIRLIAPSAPGGPVDARARWIAEKLRKSQRFIPRQRRQWRRDMLRRAEVDDAGWASSRRIAAAASRAAV